MSAPSEMTVAMLKAELSELGEDTSGKKAVLVARLESARGTKRAADDDAPAPKKAKAGKAKASTAAWFWACDGDNAKREWAAYPPDVTEKIEIAYGSAEAEYAITQKHVIVFSPDGSGLFAQKRVDNPSLVRPVARTDDGNPPTRPPPAAPGGAGGAKSASGASGASSSAAAAPPKKSSAASAVVHSVSTKAGGVKQVRYAATAGTAAKSTGGGMRVEVVKGRAAVDPSCPEADACHVYEERDDVYDCHLNQTDISANKNKYYVIQMLETDAGPSRYYVWNKWGRVGEERGSQNALRGPMSKEQAKDDFCKKFSDKTKNDWHRRDSFRTVPGKYTLIERDYGAETAPPAPAPTSSKVAVTSRLDPRVQVSHPPPPWQLPGPLPASSRHLARRARLRPWHGPARVDGERSLPCACASRSSRSSPTSP